MPAVPGLTPPSAADFLYLTVDDLRATPLEHYLEAMRACGLSTRGVEDVETARRLLAEQELPE